MSEILEAFDLAASRVPGCRSRCGDEHAKRDRAGTSLLGAGVEIAVAVA